MKMSEHWLREWVNPASDLQAIGQQLTMAGLELEGIEPAAPAFTDVIVAEVESCEKHPDADRLSVCQVNTGQESLQIVCGGKNVRAGLKVALAQVGAKLPDLKIKKGKIRGLESMGMLCSEVELGLADSSPGIMELPSDATVGESVRDYLDLDDQVIDLSITPNRGDCASVLGIAREVAVLNQLTVNIPALLADASIDDSVSVVLDDPIACPKYAGRVIKGIDPSAVSPLWLTERLRRSGLRSVSLVVDVGNYVMLALGTPMHAFDLASLKGELSVRYAKEGESVTLLNDESVSLSPDHLVIADEKGPQALAGIMGGADSSVAATTTDLFLECAHFCPEGIAKSLRKLNLHSDASYRFERGVDPEQIEQALEMATAMILELAGGHAGPIKVIQHDVFQNPVILLRKARLSRVLGMSITDEAVHVLLVGLNMEVSSVDNGWEVRAPSYRFDIRIEEDLIEEVARLYGYDALPQTTPQLSAEVPNLQAHARNVNPLRKRLCALGYREVISYSFVDDTLQKIIQPEKDSVKVVSPVTQEMNVMRTSLWAGLLSTYQYNVARQQTRLRIFEVGLSFIKHDNEINQTMSVAGLISGDRYPESWHPGNSGVDFYDIKGDVESLVKCQFGEGDVRFESSEPHSLLHPGVSANVFFEGSKVACLGALHPSKQKALKVKGQVYLFEMFLPKTFSVQNNPYRAISKFPSNRRDIAVLVDETVSSDLIVNNIVTEGGPLLRDVFVFDVYNGDNIPKNKKSLAIALILQDDSRTLVDVDVANVVKKVVNSLEREFKVELRD